MPDTPQKWNAAGIGISTFATILAAATSAGIFAVAGRQESYTEWERIAAASLVTGSLLAYLAVLFFGLAALFRETQAARRADTVKTAIAVLTQANTAVFAAFLVIYSQL